MASPSQLSLAVSFQTEISEIIVGMADEPIITMDSRMALDKIVAPGVSQAPFRLE